MSVDKVAVIVLNWNGAADTIACIESLIDLRTKDLGVYVCDNASTDDSVELIKQWASDTLPTINARRQSEGREHFRFRDLSATPSSQAEFAEKGESSTAAITFIRTGKNGGYAAGNNVGMRYALAEGFDYFWVLNNDTEVDAEAVNWLLQRMRQEPAIGMCGSTLIYHSRRDLVQNWAGAKFLPLKGRAIQLGANRSPLDPIDERSVEREMDHVSGAAMFVSRAFLEKVGLMQEDYFLYWEEMDWAARAEGLFKLGYASKSVVYHKVGASIGTNDFGDRSPLSDYYMNRSKVKFCWRFSKISLPFVFIDISRKAFAWARRGNWQRAALLGRAAIGMPYVKPK